MNKKTFLIVSILVIVALVVFFVFYKNSNITECDPYQNIANGVKACDCLKDNNARTLCQSNIPNATTYTEAIKKSDASACENISIPEMRESCVKIVQGKLNYGQTGTLNKASDPNYRATSTIKK